MKKFVTILTALVLIAAIAYAAEIALSDYSFDQLIALQKQVTAEIMSRPEWKEVTVPAGTWAVGDDIPAGSYSIHPVKNGAYLRVRDGKGDLLVYGGIRKETDIIGKIVLKDGYTVEIENGSLMFAPAIGLGF